MRDDHDTNARLFTLYMVNPAHTRLVKPDVGNTKRGKGNKLKSGGDYMPRICKHVLSRCLISTDRRSTSLTVSAQPRERGSNWQGSSNVIRVVLSPASTKSNRKEIPCQTAHKQEFND